MLDGVRTTPGGSPQRGFLSTVSAAPGFFHHAGRHASPRLNADSCLCPHEMGFCYHKPT